MPRPFLQHHTRPEPAPVLTKAVLRASEHLGVTRRGLSRILGVSEASGSRLGRTRSIDPGTKEGEMALLFLRLYRSLDALFGGNQEQCRKWYEAPNHDLGGVPADLAGTAVGLVHVTDYLDAMRGHA
jgi:uncharacterized protein (DUF2384 family)